MKDRLIELMIEVDQKCVDTKECKNCVGYGKGEYCGEHLIADHLLANGVIVPPVKVGQTVYVISQMKDKRILPFINEYEITSYTVKKRSVNYYHEMDGYIKIFKDMDFGKTIFLTREEAEQALRKEDEGK